MPSLIGQHTTRILGIGGSGVVTVAQILSVAATTAGLYVQALDQTGLAQKGGAVVSDIKVESGQRRTVPAKPPAARSISTSGPICWLRPTRHSCVTARSGRTVAVVSTGQVPTGAMVFGHDQGFP